MTYFPIRIKYLNDDFITIVKSPELIESGRSFIVLEVNAK